MSEWMTNSPYQSICGEIPTSSFRKKIYLITFI